MQTVRRFVITALLLSGAGGTAGAVATLGWSLPALAVIISVVAMVLTVGNLTISVVAYREGKRRLPAATRPGSRKERRRARQENTVGVRLSLIAALLPKTDKWRVEEMMNHRNELRREGGRLPWGHHIRLFRSTCLILWDAKMQPRRQVD